MTAPSSDVASHITGPVPGIGGGLDLAAAVGVPTLQSPTLKPPYP